jgi:L-rhamnose-H+ transport protein
MNTILGSLIVALAGLSMGSGAWTLKAIRQFRFEHWLFVGMLVGVGLLPWTVTVAFCPHAFEALSSVPASALVKANLFALGWGIANVLCTVCFVRIGVALTGGILGGLGLSLGVTVPMLFKASGLFAKAPDLTSAAGLLVLAGVAVMLAAVVLISAAGFGRDRALQQSLPTSGHFATGLIMVVIAGILSTGPNFAFAYSQGPIVSAMRQRGASEVASTFAVWAVGMLGGVLVNLAYPAYLMSRNRTWHVLIWARRELIFPALMGVQFCAAIALLGNGNLVLGALGASVGWGIYQALQILGNQAVGFLSGEWAGVPAKPRWQMYSGIALLVLAAVIMAYGNSRVVRPS